MIHPEWQEFLPRLRHRLDSEGLCHIAIKEESEGCPMTKKKLLAKHGTIDIYLDEFVTFEPEDPNWRIYRVEGAPLEEWISKARLLDFQDTPMISLSEHGNWEMCFGYDQGTLPAEAFDDDISFLKGLMDCLTEHFADCTFTLGVSIYPEGRSWGRI
jgi:hypothetical protein